MIICLLKYYIIKEMNLKLLLYSIILKLLVMHLLYMNYCLLLFSSTRV